MVLPEVREDSFVRGHLPPSIESTCPVIQLASSDAKNSTPLAMSSRRAEALERDPLDERPLALGAVRLPLALGRRVGADESRRDVVHRNAPRAELVRELPGEPDLRRLRGGVRLDAREADAEAGAAGDVDDAAAARALHPRRDGLGEVERARHVHGEDVLPLFGRHVLERTPHLAEHAAGVVDQDVDVAGRCGRFGDEPFRGVLLAHIERARSARSTGGPAQAARLEQFVLEEVAGPHVRAGPRERQADRAAEPVRRAGHDRRPAAEIRFHALTVVPAVAASASSVASDCGSEPFST